MDRTDDRAAVLFEKGAEDRCMLNVLADDVTTPASGLAFHAQQAVEKFMKAVLANEGVVFPRTHNLALLIDMLADNGVPLPPESEQLVVLTPYAAHFRYDRAVGGESSDETLDRQWLKTCVSRTEAWAKAMLGY
jgi:HEPN domain-containing protein